MRYNDHIIEYTCDDGKCMVFDAKRNLQWRIPSEELEIRLERISSFGFRELDYLVSN